MRPTNRRHLLAGIGFFSFLGFAANGFFYSLDIQKKRLYQKRAEKVLS